MLVEPALLLPFRPEQQKRAADMILADIDAALAIFEAAARGEQIGHLAPQRLVEIIAISRLEILDRVEILEQIGTMAELRELCLQLGIALRLRGHREDERGRSDHPGPAHGRFPA